MYYGDENRPLNGTAGGAYFKFIPTVPWLGGSPITSLAQSPLASGKVFGLRLGKRSGNTDFGQGSNTGQGTWIEIPNAGNPAARLRTEAANNKPTGYYRPEDIDIDQKALSKGNVRFCGVNTGNESENRNWGEVICFTDGTLDQALANTAIAEAQLFVVGNPEQAMMDNVAYQPGRGNWIFHERRRRSRGRTQQRPVVVPGRRSRRRSALRWLRSHRNAQRPECGMDRRDLRCHRRALLRQRSAQRHRPRRDPRDHRLAAWRSRRRWRGRSQALNR